MRRRLARWAQEAYRISGRACRKVGKAGNQQAPKPEPKFSMKSCAAGCESWQERMFATARQLPVLRRREG